MLSKGLLPDLARLIKQERLDLILDIWDWICAVMSEPLHHAGFGKDALGHREYLEASRIVAVNDKAPDGLVDTFNFAMLAQKAQGTEGLVVDGIIDGTIAHDLKAALIESLVAHVVALLAHSGQTARCLAG